MRKTSGLSLLLLIFLSLCLITFSVLSISESTADRNLSHKMADRTAAYYAADAEANRILSETDSRLAGYLKEAGGDPAAYLAACAGIGAELPDTAWEQAKEDSGIISFSVPVTDGQFLSVRLLIRFPENADDTLYQISAWQIVNSRDWNPDTSQHLYRTEKQ